MVYDNIVLIGFMGCGKTSVGKILARQINKKFMDVDKIIEVEQKSSVLDIFQNKGEEYFRSLEQKCMDELMQNTGQVISTGGGLPIYSSISEKSLIVYVETEFDVILNRLSVKERDKRPLFYDEARAKALFNERIHTYKEVSNFSIDATQSIQTYIHVLVDYILDQRVL
ncbi:shikimate kinase [Sulfurimonas sp.]|uniref:shikimate kinase n=1 Tax=Sulfurimonas sp. TaxID=2022749 RepID=UPI0039E3CCC7